MNLIVTLIKNEYIKLFKRKSVPVLLLLLVLFVFGISLIKPPENNYESYQIPVYVSHANVSRAIDIDYYEQKKFQFNEQKKNPSLYIPAGSNEAVEEVLKEFYEKQIALCEKAIAISEENRDDWRIEAINDLLNTSPMAYLNDYVSENGEHVDEIREYVNKYKYTQPENNSYISYFAQLKAVEENDYSESKRYLYTMAVRSVEALKAQLEEIKEQDGAGGDVDFKINKVNGMISNSERMVSAYKAALDRKISFKSVQDKMLSHTISALNSAVYEYEGMLSKEDYENSIRTDEFSPSYYNSYNGRRQTYEEYLENTREMIASYEDKGLVGLYALENDVTEMTVASSSRNKSLSYVNLFWLLAPLAIYLASGMVSKEFSSKTINLLLIRPVKRWKILIAKYVCLMTLTFGMVAVCGAVYLLGTGFIYGFADFSQPYIYVASSAAESVGFIPWLLWKVLLASIPVFGLVNLTFMFSTVTKGTAVSLILGVLSLFSSILILFFYELIDNPDVLTYMPFPYFSMWTYVFDNVVVLNDSTINIFGTIIKTNLTYGAILLVGLMIASTVLALADFTKKDIK